jgi:hypothetical protein
VPANWVESETLDAAASVHHIHQISINGDADRLGAAGGFAIEQPQMESRRINGKSRNIIASGVYGKKESVSLPQHDGSLRTQWINTRACACAASQETP